MRRPGRRKGWSRPHSRIGFHIIEVQPGHESTECHKHYFEDECVYILEGEAQAQIGDDNFSVKVGDYVNINKRIYRNKGMTWNLVGIDAIDEPNAGKK